MNDIVKLLKIQTTTDGDGFKSETTTETEVFASVESVKRSEFYSALRAGKKAEKTIVLWSDDYNNIKPDKIKSEEIIYQIIREYQTGDMFIELTLEKV